MAPSKRGIEVQSFVLLINDVRNRFSCSIYDYFKGGRKVSRVLATSSKRFHQIKIQIQQMSTVYPGLSYKT